MLSALTRLRHCLLALTAAAAVLVSVTQPTYSQAQLKLGYDNEGKVDASPASCRAFVREMMTANEADLRKFEAEVCEARTKHKQAYAEFQRVYGEFLVVVGDDNRLDMKAAADHIRSVVASCIDYRWAITSDARNVNVDIIPNRIATDCLETGSSLLRAPVARVQAFDAKARQADEAAAKKTAASRTPWVGRWRKDKENCESAFRFSENSYAPPGEGKMDRFRVEKRAKGYILTFADGYKLALSDITERSMSFYSLASGDEFTLRRCLVGDK